MNEPDDKKRPEPGTEPETKLAGPDQKPDTRTESPGTEEVPESDMGPETEPAEPDQSPDTGTEGTGTREDPRTPSHKGGEMAEGKRKAEARPWFARIWKGRASATGTESGGARLEVYPQRDSKQQDE